MSSPHRVHAKFQLNDPTSTLDGFNCTPTAAAMDADRETLARLQLAGGTIRTQTGDRVGGTTIMQVAGALRHWGVVVDVQLGRPLSLFDGNLHDGRGAIAQGASSATKGTRYQASETFGGNHAWWVNEGRGWRLVAGVWVPTDYLVFDPLGDGRRSSIVKSPFWLPRIYMLRFLSRLMLNESTGKLLGPGKVYAGFSRDTEPHLHPRFGGVATKPFPDHLTAWNANPARKINVRAGPALKYALADTLVFGETFLAYQRVTDGENLASSRVWYGDHNGTRWVHASGLRGIGGAS